MNSTRKEEIISHIITLCKADVLERDLMQQKPAISPGEGRISSVLAVRNLCAKRGHLTDNLLAETVLHDSASYRLAFYALFLSRYEPLPFSYDEYIKVCKEV